MKAYGKASILKRIGRLAAALLAVWCFMGFARADAAIDSWSALQAAIDRAGAGEVIALTEDLTAFSLGKRILLPFLSLSGLKFIPAVRDFLSVPVFFTKPELTTLTVIYDVYGDFGAAGVYLFALILGMVSAAVQEKARKGGPGSVLLFSQLVIYFALSFFSTWFSNPTVWYYFGLTFLIALWCRVPGRKRKELQMSEAAVSPND